MDKENFFRKFCLNNRNEKATPIPSMPEDDTAASGTIESNQDNSEKETDPKAHIPIDTEANFDGESMVSTTNHHYRSPEQTGRYFRKARLNSSSPDDLYTSTVLETPAKSRCGSKLNYRVSSPISKKSLFKSQVSTQSLIDFFQCFRIDDPSDNQPSTSFSDTNMNTSNNYKSIDFSDLKAVHDLPSTVSAFELFLETNNKADISSQRTRPDYSTTLYARSNTTNSSNLSADTSANSLPDSILTNASQENGSQIVPKEADKQQLEFQRKFEILMEYRQKTRLSENEVLDIQQDTLDDGMHQRNMLKTLEVSSTAITEYSKLQHVSSVLQQGSFELQQGSFELQQRTTELQEESYELQQRSSELQQGITELQEEPSELQEEPSELQEEPSELQKESSELQQGTTELQKESSELQQRSSELQQRSPELQLGSSKLHQGLFETHQGPFETHQGPFETHQNPFEFQQEIFNTQKLSTKRQVSIPEEFNELDSTLPQQKRTKRNPPEAESVEFRQVKSLKRRRNSEGSEYCLLSQNTIDFKVPRYIPTDEKSP